MVSAVRKLALAAAICTAGLIATPAMATIILVPASSIQGNVVLFNDGVQTGALVTGHTSGGTLVNFRGTTTGGGTIIRANGGQAVVEGELNTITSNPNDTLGLTSLNFSLASGTFNNLEFNLFGVEGGGQAFFTAVDNGGEVFTFGGTLNQGSNFFGFQGIDGQSIASFSIRISPGSIQDVRQIRLDATPSMGAVPEPGTWAMMLVGFGAAGVAMRRRKRAVGAMQIA